MTPAQKLNLMVCRKDAHAFIFGTTGHSFVVTKDEHDTKEPVKPFPDLLYLRALLDMYLVGGRYIQPEEAKYAAQWGINPKELCHIAETGLLAVEKSRQLMVTWLTLAYCLWRAKFKPHQLILCQSKREDDAKNLVCVKEDELDSARMSFMETHLPDYMRSMTTATKCNLFFASGSRVWGIPQGGSIIRSNTPSLLMSDEAAFQPEFGEAYTASLPAIRGGGQAIFVSSAEVGDFMDIVEAQT
jgi:hypothetical protein